MRVCSSERMSEFWGVIKKEPQSRPIALSDSVLCDRFHGYLSRYIHADICFLCSHTYGLPDIYSCVCIDPIVKIQGENFGLLIAGLRCRQSRRQTVKNNSLGLFVTKNRAILAHLRVNSGISTTERGSNQAQLGGGGELVFELCNRCCCALSLEQ